MQVLWAPWRMAYVAGPKPPGCIFCQARAADDPRAELLLVREPSLVMLNKFPYGSGHIMVAPPRHVGDLHALSGDEFRVLMDAVQRAAAIVRDAFHPQGMNIGINLGAAAGAGVADHLHWHIVPRWFGDTNFMPLLADVNVLPEHLEATYDRLRPAFAATESA